MSSARARMAAALLAGVAFAAAGPAAAAEPPVPALPRVTAIPVKVIVVANFEPGDAPGEFQLWA